MPLARSLNLLSGVTESLFIVEAPWESLGRRSTKPCEILGAPSEKWLGTARELFWALPEDCLGTAQEKIQNKFKTNLKQLQTILKTIRLVRCAGT